MRTVFFKLPDEVKMGKCETQILQKRSLGTNLREAQKLNEYFNIFDIY